jgi:hypothetical protein
MESVKRVDVGAWDRLPEEVVSMIVVKVAESSEAPFEDLCSLRMFNMATKRVCSSHTVELG